MMPGVPLRKTTGRDRCRIRCERRRIALDAANADLDAAKQANVDAIAKLDPAKQAVKDAESAKGAPT